MPDCEDGRGCFLSEIDEECFRIEEIYSMLNSPVASRHGMGPAVLRTYGIEPGTEEERKAIKGIAVMDNTIAEHWQLIAEKNKNGDKAKI